jgi:site-specific DNA recombinase
MLNEFVEKILVHEADYSSGERVQEVEIYLNFIGKFEVPMPEPTEEELAAEEKRRQKRIRDHEKYLRQKERKQKIAEGLIVPGEPYQLVCQCCGELFQSVRPNAKFCKPACREKFYRQEKRKAKETETSQTA